MDFLNKYGFTDEEIKKFENNIPDKLYNLITSNSKLIGANVDVLRKLGVDNYKEIFYSFYELFLMDNSTFVKKVDKYEKEDLIAHLTKDFKVFEYL